MRREMAGLVALAGLLCCGVTARAGTVQDQLSLTPSTGAASSQFDAVFQFDGGNVPCGQWKTELDWDGFGGTNLATATAFGSTPTCQAKYFGVQVPASAAAGDHTVTASTVQAVSVSGHPGGSAEATYTVTSPVGQQPPTAAATGPTSGARVSAATLTPSPAAASSTSPRALTTQPLSSLAAGGGGSPISTLTPTGPTSSSAVGPLLAAGLVIAVVAVGATLVGRSFRRRFP